MGFMALKPQLCFLQRTVTICKTTRGLLSKKHKQVVLSTNHLFPGHLGLTERVVNTSICFLHREIFGAQRGFNLPSKGRSQAPK